MSGNGKVAMVSGAASGLGEGLARDLYSQGYFVACLDVNEKAGIAVAEDLGPRAKFFKCNVADWESLSTAYQAVWDTWQHLDIVLANAGIVDRSSIYILKHRGKDELPLKPDLLCTDIVSKGTHFTIVLAIHFMRKNPVPGGKIVCTSSVSGLYAHGAYPEYVSAKHSIVGLVRSIAPTLKRKENININAICPGVVPTKIVPPQMVAAFQPEQQVLESVEELYANFPSLTPLSSVIKGFNKFYDDDTLFGKTYEINHDKILPCDQIPFANGESTERSCTVWDPIFSLMHGESYGPGSVDEGKPFV